MGEIESVGAEKMGWLDLPRGTSYPTFPLLFEALSVIMRPWGKTDHRLVWWVTGGPSYPNGKFRKYYGNYASSSSFAKHYLLFLVPLLLLVTAQYK